MLEVLGGGRLLGWTLGAAACGSLELRGVAPPSVDAALHALGLIGDSPPPDAC